MKKAWVISVDMGYGHQRAAYPLKDIAFERIITANSDKIVTEKERKEWHKFRRYYEGISRFRSIPVIGELLWRLYDGLQKISPFYPFRDLSKPNLGSMYMHRLINKGFCSSIADYTSREKLPFISTFFAPALAAAHAGRIDVFCVVTDTDINRVWVPENPKKDRIYYLTPTTHSTKRLIEYGVPKENIFYTGFPLPKENTGRNMMILKRDLAKRLPNLDPKKVHIRKMSDTIKHFFGRYYNGKSDHILTLTFVVGGAGAQKEIGSQLLESLKDKIRNNKIRLNLVAGTRIEIYQYFLNAARDIGLEGEIGNNLNILCELNKKSHFEKFNQLLHQTDILWTKPSELSFYAALGIPLIIGPPLGAHEVFNKRWLENKGIGSHEEDPKYTDEWLFEWLDRGIFAKMALDGFLDAPKYGTYNIEKVIFSKDRRNKKMRY